MRAFLVLVVVLAIAAVGADRVAERVATDRAEQRLAADGLTDPKVDVRGFPFLTQLLARRFRDVQVTAAGLQVASGRAQEISVTGRDVTLPRGGQADVASLRAQGVVPYAEVLRQAGARGIRLDAAGSGKVRLRGSAQVLGRTLPVSAVGKVEPAGRAVRIVPTSFEMAGASVGGPAVASALTDRFTLTYRLPGLPDGVRVEQVTPRAGGFLVLLTGRNVRVSSVSSG